VFHGNINWTVFILLLGLVYCFAVLFSVTALYFEEYSFQQYKKPSQVIKLLTTVLLEPIIYHPFVMWASIRGNIDFLLGKKSWGSMTREGLKTPM